VPETKFEITGYHVALGGEIVGISGNKAARAHGKITCKGEEGTIAAYFLKDGSEVPQAQTIRNGRYGVLFLPRDMMPVWVDLLRNEKPIYGFTNEESPQFNRISTDLEDVGEHELAP
jgi:hypothetical protein